MRKFPADDAVPLVHQHGQVAVGLDPLRPHVADDGFRCGTKDERLGEFFAAADGDDGEFGREAFDVMLFFFDEAFGNQQGERDVLVAGGLEASIQGLLNVFPERPAVGTHDHAAAHRSVVGELRLQHQLVVPLRKILRPSW